MPLQRERIIEPEFDEDRQYAAVSTALNEVHAEKLCAILNTQLNNSVVRVEIEYDVRQGKKLVGVLFKNRHTVIRPYEEVGTPEFLATCIFVYDLPRKPLHDT